MRWLPLLPFLLLAACTGKPMPDAHVPPFAKVPYQPFSRAAVVAIALREWRLFGQNIADPEADATRVIKPEREPGLWQRVGEYWWLGLNAGSAESAWTGKHDGHGTVFSPDQDGDYAWSAAFISYVMRIAGRWAALPVFRRSCRLHQRRQKGITWPDQDLAGLRRTSAGLCAPAGRSGVLRPWHGQGVAIRRPADSGPVPVALRYRCRYAGPWPDFGHRRQCGGLGDDELCAGEPRTASWQRPKASCWTRASRGWPCCAWLVGPPPPAGLIRWGGRRGTAGEPRPLARLSLVEKI